jgi:hypothetical protein
MRNERLLAYALIALGVVTLLSRLGGADWLWLGLLATIFLLGYVSRQNYGFLVAGGVLMGVAVGTLLGTQSGMLLSLAVGFLAIDRVELKPNRWAFYTAAIFAVLGGLSALSALGLLGTVGFALLLIAAGGYLLLRDRQESRTPSTPTESYSSPPPPTATTTTPIPTGTPAPAPAADPTPVSPAPASPASASPTSPPPAPPPSASPVTQEGAAAQPGRAEPVPAVVETPELSPEAEERLRRLGVWRKTTAAREGTPPYIVFSNDTLAKIAAGQPQTLEELGTVRGVGPVKLERYGQAVLAVLRGDTDPATPPEAPEV